MCACMSGLKYPSFIVTVELDPYATSDDSPIFYENLNEKVLKNHKIKHDDASSG